MMFCSKKMLRPRDIRRLRIFASRPSSVATRSSLDYKKVDCARFEHSPLFLQFSYGHMRNIVRMITNTFEVYNDIQENHS